MGFCLSWQRRIAKAKLTGRQTQPPFMCDECGFVAQNDFGLMAHKRSHKKKVVSPLDISYDYAVMKEGRERAVRVRDEESQAEKFIAEQSDPQLYTIVKRRRK